MHRLKMSLCQTLYQYCVGGRVGSHVSSRIGNKLLIWSLAASVCIDVYINQLSFFVTLA